MNTRFTEILASESIATAATKTIDVDLADPISRISIRVRGTNSSSTPTAHPAKMVSKIELKDGSDVLYSMSGCEAQAVNFFDQGHLPFGITEYENNIQCCATYHMDFGRYLWDEQLALDPNRFKNVKLNITHNKASGGSAPDAGTMMVAAHAFDEKKISPSGFLMNKEHYTYNLTAAAVEQIDMPTDYPLRHMSIVSLSAGNSPSSQMADFTLTEDGDRRVPFNNESVSELLKLAPNNNIMTENFGTLGTGSAVPNYVTPTYECYGVGTGRSHFSGGLIVAQGSGGDVDVTTDSSEGAAVHYSGTAPHGAVNIPFGKQGEIADWYDVTKLGKLMAKIKAGSSVGGSSTAEVLTQQYRRY